MGWWLLACCCLASPLAAQQSRALIGLPGFIDKFPIEDVTTPFTLDAPLFKSYDAVKAAFDALKVPVDVDDSVSRIVGLQHGAAQVRFAGYRMSQLFDCGESGMTGPNADSYRLTVVFLALLDPVDSTHTSLRVGVVAGAVPAGGSRSAAVQCGSTGALEAKLDELAAARLK